ncbi:MAG: ArsR/SmtB family transcription factor [Conexivisphaera sp.]
MEGSRAGGATFSDCRVVENGKEEEHLRKILDDIARNVDPERVEIISDAMKAMMDPTRIRIVAMAKVKGKIYACEVESAFGISEPIASYHLRFLAKAKVLARRREGKMTAYVPGEGIGWAIAEKVLEMAKGRD